MLPRADGDVAHIGPAQLAGHRTLHLSTIMLRVVAGNLTHQPIQFATARIWQPSRFIVWVRLKARSVYPFFVLAGRGACRTSHCRRRRDRSNRPTSPSQAPRCLCDPVRDLSTNSNGASTSLRPVLQDERHLRHLSPQLSSALLPPRFTSGRRCHRSTRPPDRSPPCPTTYRECRDPCAFGKGFDSVSSSASGRGIDLLQWSSPARVA